MLPTITIFGRTFAMYGLMGATGFLLGLLFIVIRGHKLHNGLTDDAVYIFTFGGIGMLVGAKLLYLLTVLPQFISDISQYYSYPSYLIAKYLTGGMVFYGGLSGAITAAWATAKSYHHKLSDYYQLIVPPVALVAGFGRIGCLCEGCCYGIPTSLPIGIAFSISPVAPNGIKLFPTQLLEAVFDFALFLWLTVKTKKKASPNILLQYLVLYSVWRLLIENFRGDAARGIVLGLSSSQWISIGIIACSICILFRQRQKNVQNLG